MSLSKIGITLAEKGLLPDAIVRKGIRNLCRKRIYQCVPQDNQAKQAARSMFAARMREGPIAPIPEAANEQHYEVPDAFFGYALGHRRKYSGCYWQDGCSSLDEAEDASLRITCERAELQDGMTILELGCGWGSLTLWMAEYYPNARIIAVSNSNSQREYIESQANEQNLTNITVVTKDMNDFETSARFDRIVSVEMFEHMRNYELLLSRISSWLKPTGKLFVHIFAHKDSAYEFQTQGADNWMGRYFFTGGIMPAQQIFNEFQEHMHVTNQWGWDGTNYQKTSEAWLERLDLNMDQVISLFRKSMPKSEARRMYYRWRIFFLACAETFGYANGKEWMIAHYLMQPVEALSHSTLAEHQLVGAAR